jgi:hypothetical protein
LTKIRALACVTAAAIAATLSACDNHPAPPVTHQGSPKPIVGPPSPTDIPRCYDKPLPPQQIKVDISSPLLLHQDTQGVMTDDPKSVSPDVQKVLDGATVQILITTQHDGTHVGTGFLTKNASGQVVVVTNLHVIGNPTPKGYMGDVREIAVFDAQGRAARVVRACGIYENEQAGFVEPEGQSVTRQRFDSVVGRDVAVLLPDAPLGTATLTIGSGLKRGNWYRVTATTQDRGPTKPVSFNTLALGYYDYSSQSTKVNAAFFISGLQPHVVKQGGIDRTQHGMSGGAIVTIPTRPGEAPMVVAMVTGSFKPPASADQLLATGTQIMGSNTATPQIDYGAQSDAIQSAVDVSNTWPASSASPLAVTNS